MNVVCVPFMTLLRHAETAHPPRTDADTFGIGRATSIVDDAAFERSRRGTVDWRCGKRLALCKKNIDEYERQRRLPRCRYTLRTKRRCIETRINFDSVIIATGSTRPCGCCTRIRLA
jgi:pyruvate/2-oxoglutarate dehydrogenase complex dihydrolipoamide dehydrogenase (E3) component